MVSLGELQRIPAPRFIGGRRGSPWPWYQDKSPLLLLLCYIQLFMSAQQELSPERGGQ